MADASGSLHEDKADLSAQTIDRHRAIMSLMEELEAVDWYDQRVDAAQDEELRAILAHNRDEEKEHACMMLEWLRRHDPGFAAELQTYLFSDGPILEAEKAATGNAGGNGAVRDGSLGIGSLKQHSNKEQGHNDE